jgi:surfeit locus 1 family protein
LVWLTATLAVAGLCVHLGLWQGRRLQERRAGNRVALEQRRLPPVDLNATEAAGDWLVQRRAVARGTYDHDRAFVLRGRVEREIPGVQVVTPLRLEGREEAVLVNRGFVPAVDAATPSPEMLSRAGDGTVRGILLRVPVSGDSGGRLEFRGGVSWRRLDLHAARARLPYPVLDVYLHLTEPEQRPAGDGGGRYPIPAALPPLDDGPHLSYMVQWFGIGAAALVFGVVFVLRSPATTRTRGNP